MNVGICDDSSVWENYVATAPNATIAHRWGWKEAVEETFEHRAYYLMAGADGKTEGILPLIHMRSLLFGNFLVSVPFSSYGGVLASSISAREQLLSRAVELAKELKAAHIELRQGVGCEVGWQESTKKLTVEVDLPGTVDELWKEFSPKLRKRIRYARNHGLRAQCGGAEDVESFYRVFAANMRNLGTPVYPRNWYENLCRRFPDEFRIFTIWEGQEPIAGAFLMIGRDGLELPWAASLPESREKFSPLLLYCTLLEWGIENGYKRVDLGRCTRDSGNHRFKQHWSRNERPLHWYYWTASDRPVPELRPDNPRYRLATRIWKKLPLAVANSLGPRIVRSIP
ncbi:MAG TPA: FemAB family XrtA/PEP-CTERM system-associated protein [Candidatus Acidoferrales bacterium]|nr:FemAB family XrtA/PEP-CTERM system-associated protein [Candidatus Acidoferrales bacterium]